MITRSISYAVTCPGQGIASLGLLLPYKPYRSTFQSELNIIDETLGNKFTQKLFDATDKNWLLKTSNAQPAILATSYIIYKIIERTHDVDLVENASFLMGHSLGEYTSLLLSGIIDFHTAVSLVRKRGKLMEQAIASSTGDYGMVACLVGTPTNSEKVIDAATRNNVLGNINSYRQIVLSGQMSKIKSTIDELNAKKKTVLKQVLLPVEIPFHSDILRDIGDQLRPMLSTINRQKVPIISNLTGFSSTDAAQTVENTLQCNHQPVQWAKSLEYLQSQGITHTVNLGPGTVLSGLNKDGINTNLDDPKSFGEVEAVFGKGNQT
jgi:[acyl-carrier-protein] S-malonyltransferase